MSNGFNSRLHAPISSRDQRPSLTNCSKQNSRSRTKDTQSAENRKGSGEAANDDVGRKSRKTKKPKTTLYLGDCLKVMKGLRTSSVDTIICDPPFGTTQCDWDLELDLEELWDEFFRVAKEDAPVVLFSAQPFTSKLIMSNPGCFRHTWYWEKEKGTNFFNANYQPLRVIEEICVFSRTTQNTYNPQMIKLDKPYTHTMPLKHSAVTGRGKISDSQDNERQYKKYTHAHPKNILKFPRDRERFIPTQKPLALLEYIVKTYTDRGDVVLDATMGSNTCGLACRNLGRGFVGIEKNKRHFENAKARMES